MKSLTFFFFIFLSTTGFSQITGKVTDTLGNPLPYVNIYLKNTPRGTTTNDNGSYELEMEKPGKYTLVFQYLGYRTENKNVEVQTFPFTLNVSLQKETTSLAPVTITNGDNPAIAIIEQAIAHRKENLAKLQQFTADFYSRGLWRVKNVPKKFMGREIGDLGGSLDSTRSGVVYLSETVSKIAFKAPDQFKEKILASKVSGNDNGFSFNSAREFNISFYKNTLDINAELVSPIADYAFNYYDYKLDGTFYDEQNHLINKIKVIPKRAAGPVFSGFIYIVEDTWEIYGIDLKTTGKSMQFPIIEELVFKQNFKFSVEKKQWVLRSQNIRFSWSVFGILGSGRFIATYSNYDFSPQFTENTFTNEILSFAENANEKDSLFWRKTRPVPLTEEEIKDYIEKDSIQRVRNSKVYLDSIDRERNKIGLGVPLFGYHWQNSPKNLDFDISGPLWGTHFSTVQGWNVGLNSYFRKELKEPNQQYWKVFAKANYGFSDERFRVVGGYEHKFNNFSKPVLRISGGVETRQINNTEPVAIRENDIFTIFFEKNYLKMYESVFAEASYSQELFNGFRLYSTLSYQKRKPLFNTTDHVIVVNGDSEYTSNNPLQPQNFGSAPFKEHNIGVLELTGRFNFGQKYYLYPNGKFIADENEWPTLFVGYEKGFAASIDDYNYQQLKMMLTGDLSLQNKGNFDYILRAGTLFNNSGMAFLDYQHFKGDQTWLRTTLFYLEKFNLLPYYKLSTNKSYVEAHFKHDFEGWVLGKIPLVKHLDFNLILGANALYTTGNQPYSEYSIGIGNIGFGKYRIFRVDYVNSYQGGWLDASFVVAVQLLGLLES